MATTGFKVSDVVKASSDHMHSHVNEHVNSSHDNSHAHSSYRKEGSKFEDNRTLEDIRACVKRLQAELGELMDLECSLEVAERERKSKE